MTNLGKWDRWYSLLDPAVPEPYGDSPTYALVAAFAEPLPVADWGCGKGWLRRFVTDYHGVDGSATPFADEVADLAAYRTPSPVVVIRHVLEHDYRWRDILRNAAAAAGQRLAIVLFTPTGDHTHEIAWNDGPGVPDLSFALTDILGELGAFDVHVTTLHSPTTQYKLETVLLCERRPT